MCIHQKTVCKAGSLILKQGGKLRFATLESSVYHETALTVFFTVTVMILELSYMIENWSVVTSYKSWEQCKFCL